MAKTPETPGRPNALSSQQVERAIVLLASGVPQNEVARMFGVHRQTIHKYMKDPEAQERLELWRNTVKATVLMRAAEGTVSKAFDMADRAIKDNDPKGFDATTRGIAALEKASASASGEGRKVELTGADGGPVQVDARALLGAVIDHLNPPA